MNFGPLGRTGITFMSQDKNSLNVILFDQQHRNKQAEVNLPLPLLPTPTSALGADVSFFCMNGCEQEWQLGGFK